MGLQVNKAAARAVLEDAVRLADSTCDLPGRWRDWTLEIGAAPSRTFTAALGTALLAKATEPDVDPMALKSTSSDRAYSARSLCHGVLVPASIEFGIDLGATGREPLNNQPFFRYDRIDEMDRVHSGARAAHDRLVRCLQEVAKLDQNAAKAALAAFVRVRMAEARRAIAVDLRDADVDVVALIQAAGRFITANPEGGRRGQALVAGVFDVAFTEVRMGRVNDPSRRFPGDVQVLERAAVLLAAEVRQKTVSDGDVRQFGAALREGGVASGMIVALDRSQPKLDRYGLLEQTEADQGVSVHVIEGADELIMQAIAWSGRPLKEVLSQLPQRVAERLVEIEVSPDGLQAWQGLVASKSGAT